MSAVNSFRDIIYIFVSINNKPLAEYFEKVGNFREFTITMATDMKKGKYVVTYPQ